MTQEAEWRDPRDGEYELRFTARALKDLGASGCLPSDCDDVGRATRYPDMVRKFVKQRTISPDGTEGCLSKVHRSDIFKLDGRDGARAVTWHDASHAVVWMLGFTAEHDYTLFEARGANAELMPSPEDYEELFDERDGRNPVDAVRKSLGALVARAAALPGQIVAGELAGIVRAEARCDDQGRLFVRFHMPPIQRGVLPGQFPYALLESLPQVSPSSVRQEPFLPGAGVTVGDWSADLLGQ